jgi:hypothetical protein
MLSKTLLLSQTNPFANASTVAVTKVTPNRIHKAFNASGLASWFLLSDSRHTLLSRFNDLQK